MIKRALGNTGLQVSEIGFGALEIGRDWAPDVNPDPSHPSKEEAGRLLNRLLDLGVNFIDTAPAYWSSEEFIGAGIAHRRDEYILATKVGEQCDRSGSMYDYSGPATLAFIDRSLQKLKTDHIDLLQIHSASLDVLEKGETLAAMQQARDAGKVLHIGMTGGVKEALRAIEIGGYETVQVPYNLLALAAEDELLAKAHGRGIGVILMRGLAGGKLTEKHERLADEALKGQIAGFTKFLRSMDADTDAPSSLAELGIRYLLSREEVSTIILGTRHVATLEANLAAAKRGALTPELATQVRDYARTLEAKTW